MNKKTHVVYTDEQLIESLLWEARETFIYTKINKEKEEEYDIEEMGERSARLFKAAMELNPEYVTQKGFLWSDRINYQTALQ